MNGFFGRVLTPRNGGMSNQMMMAAYYDSNVDPKSKAKKARRITIVGTKKESGEKKRITYTLNPARKPGGFGSPELGHFSP